MDRDLRTLTALDRLISVADEGLRVLFGDARAALRKGRPEPRPAAGPEVALEPREARHAAGLMRINHAGEICAQALYQGQALVAHDERLRAAFRDAAREEGDHLAWCASRLAALGARPSRLNPLWYSGALLLGVAAGALGDRWSLGFLAETERQVEGHLTGHLAELPQADRASRAVVAAMREDEVRHGETALHAGARPLPMPISRLMHLASRGLVRAAYWI